MTASARIGCIVATLAVCLLTLRPLPADADPCSGSGEAESSALGIGMSCGIAGGSASEPGGSAQHAGQSAFEAYRWQTVCIGVDPDASGGAAAVDCAAARVCPDPAERLWRLWGRTASGTWSPLYTQCFGRPPTAADAPRPTVTPALVLTALRRIGLPAIQARTQPEDKTLVNFDTIFYAEPQTFRRTITLLGQRVDVEAQPARYVWHHGDGTTEATTTPGAPYPRKDVTYQYTDAHRTVQASVDVVYSARFRVGGGAWQDIVETVTIAGPPTPLRISEATPVLSGDYE